MGYEKRGFLFACFAGAFALAAGVSWLSRPSSSIAMQRESGSPRATRTGQRQELRREQESAEPGVRARGHPDQPWRPFRWEAYRRVDSSSPAMAEQYLRLGGGTLRSPEETIEIPGEIDSDWIVIEQPDRARMALAIGELRKESFRLAGSKGQEVMVVARDHEFRGVLSGLLIDHEGAPYGRVVAEPLRLRLPFLGHVLVPGYMPAALRLTKKRPIAELELRRAGHVTGYLRGAIAEGEVLHCRPGEPGGRDVAVAMRSDGWFRLGPLPVGSAVLQYFGGRAYFPGGAREIEVRPGEQHLGELALQSFCAVRFRLVGYQGDGTAYVSLYFRDEQEALARSISWKTSTRGIGPTGLLDPIRVREGKLRGWLWTQDGHHAAIDLAIDGADAEREIPVPVQRPGMLLVTVSSAGVLSGGCTVLLTDASYGISAEEAFRLHGFRPQARIVGRVLTRQGRARIQGLWPVEYRVSLLSPDGALLGSRNASVASGKLGTVSLEAAPVGHLLVKNSRGDKPLRLAITSPARGFTARRKVSPGGECRLGCLPVGEYELVDLSDGETMLHTARRAPRRRLSIVFGQTRVLTL